MVNCQIYSLLNTLNESVPQDPNQTTNCLLTGLTTVFVLCKWMHTCTLQIIFGGNCELPLNMKILGGRNSRTCIGDNCNEIDIMHIFRSHRQADVVRNMLFTHRNWSMETIQLAQVSQCQLSQSANSKTD